MMNTMLNLLDAGLDAVGLERRRSRARLAATLVATGAASALIGAAVGVLLTPTGAPARAKLKQGLDGVKQLALRAQAPAAHARDGAPASA